MIFISYSWVDSPVVRSLYKELRAFDQKVWIDYRDLNLTRAIEPQIRRALSSASYVLLIDSTHARRSHWVQFELACAAKANVPLLAYSAFANSKLEQAAAVCNRRLNLSRHSDVLPCRLHPPQ